MSFDTMKTFFALLALAANAVVLGYVGLLVSGRAGVALRKRIGAALAGYELPFAWVAATTATLGSLYLSEVVNLIPCTYCWYQRIAMYPLVVILAIAFWRRDPSAARFAAPLAVIGILISTWHYTIEQFPSLGGDACNLGVPCNSAYFWQFGFITIAYMAWSAFALILVFLHIWSTNTRADAPSLVLGSTEPV